MFGICELLEILTAFFDYIDNSPEGTFDYRERVSES